MNINVISITMFEITCSIKKNKIFSYLFFVDLDYLTIYC